MITQAVSPTTGDSYVVRFFLDNPLLTGVIAYFVVGLIVNYRCLSRSDDFSWFDLINPTKGWLLPTESEAFLQSVFYTAPFWPIILIVKLASRQADAD